MNIENLDSSQLEYLKKLKSNFKEMVSDFNYCAKESSEPKLDYSNSGL